VPASTLGFQKDGQHGRGAEIFDHVVPVPPLARHDLVDAGMKTGDVRPGRTGIGLGLAVDREFPGARVSHHARLAAEAGHQHREDIPSLHRAGHGRHPRVGNLKGKRGFSRSAR
jgi:hypothetical protein